MRNAQRQRRIVFAGLVGAGVGAIVLSALTLFAGAGVAASSQAPVNTSPPRISGTAQEGRTLTGDRGSWTNNPTAFDYTWLRCNRRCSDISGAHRTTYTLTRGDVGNTIRLKVVARKANGANKTAFSAPTAVVAPAGGSSQAPVNTSPPRISGTAQEGRTLTGDRGSWTNNPSAFDYTWLRCNRSGAQCSDISGAHGTTYTLTRGDVGNTVRLKVVARNANGANTTAFSAPTPVVQGATPPSPGNGCPPGTGNPDQVTGISAPARLLVDTLRSDPPVVTRGTSTLVVRFHVTSTCGGSVQGALVYATATPYNQFSIPAEAATGADGWATLVFQRLSGFPVSRHQQLIAMFVRARKSGENLLAGISTRRLVSIPVTPA
jgi:hypothetical protein